MAKKTKADKKTKSTVNKVSYHYRPDNMTLQDWQIALRRQAAMKEKFVISERDKKEYPGYYTVINPTSGNEYNVVYRGHQSPWNYCSCMDFQRFPCYTREDFFDYFIEYGLERKDVKFAVSRHRILPYTCLIRESVKFACESVRTMRRSSANWQVLILLATE